MKWNDPSYCSWSSCREVGPMEPKCREGLGFLEKNKCMAVSMHVLSVWSPGTWWSCWPFPSLSHLNPKFLKGRKWYFLLAPHARRESGCASSQWVIATTKGQRMPSEGGGQNETENLGKAGLVDARAYANTYLDQVCGNVLVTDEVKKIDEITGGNSELWDFLEAVWDLWLHDFVIPTLHWIC